MNYINKGKRDILIFPKFKNINNIQEIRKKYVELFDKIMPHITLAFPFDKDISNEQLKYQLEKITENIEKFKIKCKGITFKRENEINQYYIFLNIIEGKERIEEIHTQIYDNILNDINIKNYNYDPHITLGCVNSTDEKVETEEEFETIIDKIVVERIGEDEESIIEFEIELH